MFIFLCFFLCNVHAQTNDDHHPYTVDTTINHHPLRFGISQLYAPGSLIAGGLIFGGNGRHAIKHEIANWRNQHLPDFRSRADNLLQFSPLVIAYGLDAAGVRSRTDILNRSIIMLKGEIITFGIAEIIKRTVREPRPNHEDNLSFPSGHTSQAFAAATLLSEEYKDRFKWMPYLSYSIASSVGILRMANNKHYINDVLVGAGLGILSMKLAYWTHQYRWGQKKQILLPD